MVGAAAARHATQTANTREQWLCGLLTNRLVGGVGALDFLARRAPEQAVAVGQAILLSMDSTSLADRCAVLLISVRRADRPLSLLCGSTVARPIRLSPGSGCCWRRCRPVARRPGGDAIGGSIHPSAALFE